jgi:hypothetical protein
MKDAQANLFGGLSAPSVLPALLQQTVNNFYANGRRLQGEWKSFARDALT